jgi:Tol biopolymer transport system component
MDVRFSLFAFEKQAQWVLRAGFLLLFLVVPLTCTANSLGQISEVAVSPDGKFITVTYEKGHARFIYKISMDTHNAVRLTAATAGKESSPAFSADGKLAAYSYVPEKQNQRIIVMNLDGSGQHSVAESGTANLDATFALDGKKIYFARSQPPPLDHAWDLFSVDSDGTNVQRLTHGMFYRVSQPSLSPDGKSIAVMTIGADAHRQIAIYSLERPEQPSQSLQPHVPKEASHDPIIDYPNYLPDGKSILFMAASDRKGWKGELDYDIYRVYLATGALERLTTGNGIASNLKVFADGKTAVFLKWRKNWRGTPDSNELYLLDLQSYKLTPFEVNGLD